MVSRARGHRGEFLLCNALSCRGGNLDQGIGAGYFSQRGSLLVALEVEKVSGLEFARRNALTGEFADHGVEALLPGGFFRCRGGGLQL